MLMLLGLFLCFLGARSVRFAVLVAGFCGAWILADELDASTGTTFLVAAADAAGVIVLAVLWVALGLLGRSVQARRTKG
jgi:hypothetical protein